MSLSIVLHREGKFYSGIEHGAIRQGSVEHAAKFRDEVEAQARKTYLSTKYGLEYELVKMVDSVSSDHKSEGNHQTQQELSKLQEKGPTSEALLDR